ncbi:Imm63 family immunity protein [Cupriavidus pinatubonensis]|uniref:Imm63 family immunity protein n=1 Tax=Cupriavidus pinatubonensis TaxID=248026 RepID=UPI00112B04D6|nr:Imm63 family immunity protein [Cupriavidus pinatubonensis]TPQ34680.1 hypothetical protein C2U69_21900 [Cupriavidus pinatubonensis]
MMTASEVQDMIYSYGQKAAISRRSLFLPTVPVGDGSPHLEIGDGKYHLVYSERGMEFGRRSSASIDDILYWYFDSVTSTLAFNFELENRVEGQDCRRIAFAKKRELIHSINGEWDERLALEIQKILRNNPFRDG